MGRIRPTCATPWQGGQSVGCGDGYVPRSCVAEGALAGGEKRDVGLYRVDGPLASPAALSVSPCCAGLHPAAWVR